MGDATVVAKLGTLVDRSMRKVLTFWAELILPRGRFREWWHSSNDCETWICSGNHQLGHSRTGNNYHRPIIQIQIQIHMESNLHGIKFTVFTTIDWVLYSSLSCRKLAVFKHHSFLLKLESLSSNSFQSRSQVLYCTSATKSGAIMALNEHSWAN